ncbi:MAG TPA: hypothetical protein PKK26_07390 [Candidatus Wallbacteria bacterium]|nr:hypothetical protein [Candidatus Wallbacteria bacterium]
MFKTTLTAIFLSIIIALQITGFPKLITGVIVNSIYILLYFAADIKSVIMLAILTPSVAFFTGHLPPFMVPVAPFIAAGNVSMVLCYHFFKDKNKAVRMIAPAFLKALIIGVSGSALAEGIAGDPASKMAIHIVMFIQFFTAAFGIFLGEYLNIRISRTNKK